MSPDIQLVLNIPQVNIGNNGIIMLVTLEIMGTIMLVICMLAMNLAVMCIAGNEFGGDVHGNGAGFGGVSYSESYSTSGESFRNPSEGYSGHSNGFSGSVTVFLVIIMDFLVQTKDISAWRWILGSSEGFGGHGDGFGGGLQNTGWEKTIENGGQAYH
ncbi:hypothetical protein TNCT_411721 [Trichonephila clavata]|uniref:Uncharacterized protein n=1 Tax=Trichonephila clavata TaxID=2740835 RepID=A0A8X6H201_TRICU|nr:hypothetical protein TNCT_411721 [Trichonephila clavata]